MSPDGPARARNAAPITTVGKTKGMSSAAHHTPPSEGESGEHPGDGQRHDDGEHGGERRLPEGEPGDTEQRLAVHQLGNAEPGSTIGAETGDEDAGQRVDEEVAEEGHREAASSQVIQCRRGWTEVTPPSTPPIP